jgi:hypothetical protein
MTNFSALVAQGVSARAKIKDDMTARVIIEGELELLEADKRIQSMQH